MIGAQEIQASGEQPSTALGESGGGVDAAVWPQLRGFG
ncbi:hypothetical protein I553_1091 [Mycobacterium xenopi 4042]|uniref:Uncharacterized protein n=1 Tax=Mycobacterium xenopi 4042 TaxID=1299334 RepID=X7ZAT0_MYCXE|nr:hypothetical protein I553_1091 [Mycobacterium xenopi 4042]